MIIDVEKNVFESNDIYAKQNRMLFQEKGVYVINIISSPGAGKTTVLEALIPMLKKQMKVAVIEGDLYTSKDADRIELSGIDVVQINTKGACHLDALMIHQAVSKLRLEDISILIIENVGNLVCPAEFDLGETMKLHIASVTEGNDKPLKYPLIYEKTEVVLLNKIDILPYTDFSLEEYKKDIENIHPNIVCFTLSARTGVGVKEVASWMIEKIKRRYEGAESK